MRAARTKLFQNGGSQAVRLPKECRFTAQGEVLGAPRSRRVVLEAALDRTRQVLVVLHDQDPHLTTVARRS